MGRVYLSFLGIGSKRSDKKFFFNMLQYAEGEWKFEETGQGSQKDKLLPHYNKLKALGIEEVLRSFSKELADYRNGFDHAWTLKPQALLGSGKRGRNFSESWKRW